MKLSNWENKSVLVTGATGLIGSHLVNELLNRNATVIAMGRTREKLENVFKDVKGHKKLNLVVGNISEGVPSELEYLDYIFHAASPISGTEIQEKPVDTICANLNGTIECLEKLKDQGSGRLVVFSSATVYGNQLDQEMEVREEDTANADALHTANTPYSESKRMIEVLARGYHKQYGVDSVIVRMGYVYGFVNPSPKTAFYEFINKAISGENIVLNNSGMGRRDNIHVNDVINGLLLVAEKGETIEAYNISSDGDLGNYRAIDEVASMIADATNDINTKNNIKAVVKPIEGDRKPGLRLNNSKMKALGWRVGISLEDGIKDVVKKYMG